MIIYQTTNGQKLAIDFNSSYPVDTPDIIIGKDITSSQPYIKLGENIISGSGLEYNIEFSQTAPTDTTKLWAKCDKPSKIIVSQDLYGGYNQFVQRTDLTVSAAAPIYPFVQIDNKLYSLIYPSGEGTISYKIYCTDLSTGTETELTPSNMPERKQFPSMVTDGTDIYFGGGFNSSDIPDGNIYKFDIANNSVTSIGVLDPARGNMIAKYIDGYIYFIQGNTDGTPIYGTNSYPTVTKFSIQDGTSVTLGTVMATEGSACSVYKDKIFLFGGYPNGGTSDNFYYWSNMIYEIDTSTGTITKLDSYICQVSDAVYFGGPYCAEAFTMNDYIYITGGCLGSDSTLTRIFQFNPKDYSISELSLTIPSGMQSGYWIPNGGTDNKDFFAKAGGSIYQVQFTNDLEAGTGKIELDDSPVKETIINSDQLQISASIHNFKVGNVNNKGELQEIYRYNNGSWILI